MTDLRRLQYFLAVARERNFTRAAERLHVAQPALSRQVKLLEQELGVDLLHRTTHEFELTDAGEFLLAHGPAVLNGVDDLWRSVRSYAQGARGTVRVAYGASASYETAPRLLQTLAERHPELAITTEVRSVAEIVAGLTDGSMDVGLVRCPPDVPALEARTVRLEHQGLLVRRDHALASRSSVEVADLRDQVLALHPRAANPGHYDAVIALCRERDFEPRVTVRSLTFDLAYSPVTHGEAVALVGESSNVGLPAELCWVPVSPPVALVVSLLARRQNRSPAVTRLLEAATEVSGEFGWI